MAEYVLPDPVVQIAGVQEVARDLVVIPNRRVQLVPNIGVIGGAHSVLVIDTGMGPRNAEKRNLSTWMRHRFAVFTERWPPSLLAG